MTLIEVDKIMKRTIRVLESMASSSGCHIKEASDTLENKIFKDTELYSNSKIIQMNSGQFTTALPTILKTDLLPSIPSKFSDPATQERK